MQPNTYKTGIQLKFKLRKLGKKLFMVLASIRIQNQLERSVRIHNTAGNIRAKMYNYRYFTGY
jgi:hypothetical protein